MSRGRPIVAAVLLVVAAGCAGTGDEGSTASNDDPYVQLYQGLCQARAQASQPEAAREIFFDRVHQPLHELAIEAAGADRAAAAKLHEAKHAVERDLAHDPESLRGDLDRLAEATRRAIPATGRATPGTGGNLGCGADFPPKFPPRSSGGTSFPQSPPT